MAYSCKALQPHKQCKWRLFLSQGGNKTSLVAFFVNEWNKPKCPEKLNDKILFVTAENLCYKITTASSKEVPELRCTEEESDGRLLLHAAHAAAKGYKSVVICSEYTDVVYHVFGIS